MASMSKRLPDDVLRDLDMVLCSCVCVFSLFESAARKSDRILFLFFLAWGRSKLWRCFSSSSLLGTCADVAPPVAVAIDVAALSFLSVLLISLSL